VICNGWISTIKGKYLTDDFIARAISNCNTIAMLRLTGLEMELCFKPAIENFVNKDYDTIYIDTATF
jgi:hypothetical protein